MRAMDDVEPDEFEERFLRDGYFVVDRCMGKETADFINEMRDIDAEHAKEESRSADTTVGPWSQSPARRTLWINEEQ
eukprot:CAMPEP_0180542108 /NCGR_PEP_ID=MMETSP1036_2-20121128/68292_1 /TAXON_ID=632150 /ORGANISM="Azadinium spinosum, Strain 3D9" /LENGTH=76 /DNA_ID=CAMNT_0022556985 /DNA_START=12 /DNA_END=239 /DNA_ORIENTATION=-